jgi:hypothetical protein
MLIMINSRDVRIHLNKFSCLLSKMNQSRYQNLPKEKHSMQTRVY